MSLIDSNDFRVQPGGKVKLEKWPTRVAPYCHSKAADGLIAASGDWLNPTSNETT